MVFIAKEGRDYLGQFVRRWSSRREGAQKIPTETGTGRANLGHDCGRDDGQKNVDIRKEQDKAPWRIVHE